MREGRRSSPRPCHAHQVTEEVAGPGLHPLLASRWSPTTFDATREATPDDVDLLLEAARFAPSAGNSQPWAFIVGRRGDETHRHLVQHLAGSTATWAPTASLLVANLCHRHVEGTDWEYSEFSSYDLGQAVAHMTVQARALGLHVRQFRAFHRARIGAEFDVPGHWEVTTMSAIGWLATGSAQHGRGPAGEAGRHRRPLDDLLWVSA